jgi:hypothetical protein
MSAGHGGRRCLRGMTGRFVGETKDRVYIGNDEPQRIISC